MIVVSLAAVGLTLAGAGGKGKNLSEMIRAGLPVPGGFVVTTEAYRRFVAAHSLDAAIAAGWAACEHIGGVVLEVGGLLSHGAIVAREYGLPAVVNLPRVTERIPDGATLTVDGAMGRVLVHSPKT